MTRIEIRRSKAKQPFRVVYLSAKNNKGKVYEPLSVTENLPSRANCITNIRSMAKIFTSTNLVGVTLKVPVMDYSKSGEGKLIYVRL